MLYDRNVIQMQKSKIKWTSMAAITAEVDSDQRTSFGRYVFYHNERLRDHLTLKLPEKVNMPSKRPKSRPRNGLSDVVLEGLFVAKIAQHMCDWHFGPNLHRPFGLVKTASLFGHCSVTTQS